MTLREQLVKLKNVSRSFMCSWKAEDEMWDLFVTDNHGVSFTSRQVMLGDCIQEVLYTIETNLKPKPSTSSLIHQPNRPTKASPRYLG